jgi:molecular chaperone GrpE (heat shock protein)
VLEQHRPTTSDQSSSIIIDHRPSTIDLQRDFTNLFLQIITIQYSITQQPQITKPTTTFITKMLNLPNFVLLALATSSSQAFSFVSNKNNVNKPFVNKLQSASPPTATCQLQHRSNLILFSTEESSDADAAAAAAADVDSAEENTEQAEAEITNEEPNSEEEEEEPQEDPEITELKQQIAQLESQLKQKNRDLNSIERMADEYSKGGYARKVAEMESFRRSKSAASTDNVMVARAASLTNFLPILEKLGEVNEKYQENEFAKSYNALSWDFKNALKDLGVVEYTVNEGSVVDPIRVTVVGEEYSDTIAKGTVIQPVAIGYELDGNVMRPSAAIVSLGPEAAQEEETSEEAVEEEGANEA